MSDPARSAPVPLRVLALAGIVALIPGCAPSESDWCRELSGNDPFRRVMAAVALGEAEPTGTPGAMTALVGALGLDQADLRSRVVDSIARRAPSELSALTQTLPSHVLGHLPREEGLRDALELGRDRVIPALLETLGRAESEEDDPALALLPWFRRKPVEEILGLLADAEARPSPRARARAARVLGEMPGVAQPAIPALFDMLSDPDPEARREAAQALDRIGPHLSQRRLALLLRSPSPESREFARTQLCRSFSDAARIFVADFDGKNIRDALRALRAMWELGDCSEARAESEKMLLSGSALDVASNRALDLWRAGFSDHVDDAMIARLGAALDDEVRSVRCCAALALGRLGRRAESVEPALEILVTSGGPVVRDAARLALQEIRER